MNKYTRFGVMVIALFVLMIATAGVIVNALWNENYLQAIFFLLLYGMYGGVAKALGEYGNKLLKERKMENGKN